MLAPGAGFDGNAIAMMLFDPDGQGSAKADLVVWGQFSNLSGTPTMQIARYDVAYFPGLPSQPDGTVPYFKLDYNTAERAFSVGVSLGTLDPPNFNDPSAFNVSGGPTSAATADLNNDGQSDLITVNSTTGTLAAKPGEPMPGGTVVPFPQSS